ncbi:MAG TPA: hemerythrin domain-containing protein [Myxococcales bacterium]|nr:hemerythrin domain-containing protein [Myxococcales bacterium]
MKATSLLMEEHEIILRALTCLDALAARAAAGQPVPENDVAAVMKFLSDFADGHHHGKEENILFPAMEEAGFPRDAGPLGVMLHEHQQGRALIAALREAASPPDAVFAQAARAYAALLRQHIEKENHILFRMADQAIEGEARQRVDAAVEQFESKSGSLRATQEAAIARLQAELP